MNATMMPQETAFSPQVYNAPNAKRALSPSFQPGPFDVICARGKLAHAHPGNKSFRELVRIHRDAYAQATSKYQKSQIVSHITNVVRQSSPEGGFVKNIKGVWYEVGDRQAKEKIGQTMRDLLHTMYSSSTKAKARVRIQKRVEEYNASPEALQHKQSSDGVSVVSHDSSEDRTVSIPSHIQVTIPPPTVSSSSYLPPLKQQQQQQHPGQEYLLDSMMESDNNNNSSSSMEPLPLAMEPLPLNQSTPIEFHDSDLRQTLHDSLGEGGFEDFCNVMGVAV